MPGPESGRISFDSSELFVGANCSRPLSPAGCIFALRQMGGRKEANITALARPGSTMEVFIFRDAAYM